MAVGRDPQELVGCGELTGGVLTPSLVAETDVAGMKKTSAQADVPEVLPYGQHLVEDDDIEAVVKVLREDLLTGGCAVAGFEDALAAKTGAAHAVSCSSGTAALHLAYASVGLGPCKAAIVPAITFLASANAAIYCGAEVVFADVDSGTGLMEAQHLSDALDRVPDGVTPHLVAPVHLNGQCCDMEKLHALARKHNLAIVEDACHAIGGRTRDGKTVGACAWSDAACFSFHPVKTIAMGEGGSVTTQSSELAKQMELMRNHGMSHRPENPVNPELGLAGDGSLNPWYYEMAEPGYNYRASTIHCALGLSQLAKLERFVEQRLRLMSRYRERLLPLAPVVKPVPQIDGSKTAWHLNSVLIDFKSIDMERSEFMRALRGLGIGAQVHYLPVPWQSFYRARYGALPLPGAKSYYTRQLSLPLFVAMNETDVDRVVDALESVIGR